MKPRSGMRTVYNAVPCSLPLRRQPAKMGTFLAMALWPAVAWSQTPAPPPTPEAPQPAQTTAAPAPDSAVARAEALFNEGVASLKAGNYALACPKLEESHKLDPAPGTLFNLANCETEQGHFATAARRWRELLALLPDGHSRRDEALKQASETEAKAGRLVLRLAPQAPPGTSVSLDARPLAPAELSGPLLVDPGTYRILVSAPGYQPRDFSATTASGETKEVVLTPGPAMPAPPPPPNSPVLIATTTTTPPAGDAQQPGFFKRHTTSLALLGGAVVPAAVAVGLSVEIIDGHYSRFVDTCTGTKIGCPEAKKALDGQVAAINTLVTVAGVAGAAAGVLFILEEIKHPSKPGAQVSLAVGPMGASLTVRR